MPRVSRDTLAALKQRLDIVAVIQPYVPLKKRGNNYLGLCPFHNENTPSFTVSPAKSIYHCFGCHASGDSIGFMMALDGLSFVDAVTRLAGQVGLDITYDTVSDRSSNYSEGPNPKQGLYDALDNARLLFIKCLKSNKAAQDYLLSRGIPSAIQDQFSLGLSPPDTRVLVDSLGVDPATLQAAGLVMASDTGQYVARFRNRIMFPISDKKGRTVGFGGRLYCTNSGPKYLNSPETSVFSKSRLLYGWHQAQAPIRRSKRCIITEGYSDVLVAHAQQFTDTVGTMGTNVSAYHTELLPSDTQIYLALDSDSAGQTAMAKISDAFDTAGLSVKLVNLDETDPADFLVSHGADAFKHRLSTAVNPVVFHLDRLTKNTQLDAYDKRALVEQVAPFIRRQSDPIIRHHYIQLVSQATGLSEPVIQDKLQLLSVSALNQTGYVAQPRPVSKYSKAAAIILAAIASKPDKINTVLTDPLVFNDPVHQADYTALLAAGDWQALPDDSRGRITDYMMRYDTITDQAFQDAVRLIQASQRNKKITTIKQALRELEAKDSSPSHDATMQALVAELSSLLKASKQV